MFVYRYSDRARNAIYEICKSPSPRPAYREWRSPTVHLDYDPTKPTPDIYDKLTFRKHK